MELKGEYRIEAPREKVWEALNDPDVLRQSIPGCQELEQSADDEFSAKVKAKVGPVNAKFSGKVTLSDINPPESYTISGEGSGGAAGFAKGSAKVHLAEEEGATLLTYNADAQVGGKLAQIGSRLIQGTARKMADQFFGNFAQQVGAPVEKPGEGKVGGGESESAGSESSGDGEKAASDSANAESDSGGQAPSPQEEQKIAEETSKAAERGAALGHTMPEGPTGDAAERSDASAETPAASSSSAKSGSQPGKSLPMAVWAGGLIVVVVILLAIFAL